MQSPALLTLHDWSLFNRSLFHHHLRRLNGLAVLVLISRISTILVLKHIFVFIRTTSVAAIIVLRPKAMITRGFIDHGFKHHGFVALDFPIRHFFIGRGVRRSFNC